MRPYGCLSNGEAARFDVAVAICEHENDKKAEYCIINDFACVVNRDAAMSMACAARDGVQPTRTSVAGQIP